MSSKTGQAAAAPERRRSQTKEATISLIVANANPIFCTRRFSKESRVILGRQIDHHNGEARPDRFPLWIT